MAYEPRVVWPINLCAELLPRKVGTWPMAGPPCWELLPKLERLPREGIASVVPITPRGTEGAAALGVTPICAGPAVPGVVPMLAPMLLLLVPICRPSLLLVEPILLTEPICGPALLLAAPI